MDAILQDLTPLFRVISTAAVTTPSGWSVTASHNWVAYGYRSYVFTKVKAADTSVNVTTNLGGAQLIAYSGTRGAGSVGAFAESAQGATTLALNSITPQSAASTVLGFITDRDVVALTPAAGFTSRATVNHTYFANQVADKGFGSTAPTGNQTWTQGNYYPAAGLLLELLPPLVPTLQAAYAPTTLITGGTATLTYTLTNPNSTPLTNVRFTANLGSVSVASTTLGGSCAGVTSSPALTVGASSLDLTVPTLAAGGCTISVQVTSSTLGSHGHAATGPTSNETDPGSAANTATVTVVTQPSPPTVTAKFEPAWMESGSQSTLRINLASPMNVALTNVNFTGTLTGMTVASATIGGTCAGVTNSPALAVGATSLNLTVPSLPASGCSVTVQVTSVTMGSNPVVMSGATSAESGGSGSAPPTFYLTVAEDPGFMYVHPDHLGTPRAITRPSDNALVWKWDSVEPFGNNPANESPSGLGSFAYNLRHPGQYSDAETGTFYNYFRDYDPTTGRYRQSDPIGLEGGINTYAYVDGNPLIYIDPLGLYWEYCSGTGEMYYVSSTKRTLIGTGYAGQGKGLNNPEMECEENVGPPPENIYEIGKAKWVREYGANAMKLKPKDNKKMCKRKDFWIHRKIGSIGCINLDDDVLKKIAESPDRELRVKKKCSRN